MKQVTAISITYMPLGSAGLLMTRLFGGIAGKTEKHKSTA